MDKLVCPECGGEYQVEERFENENEDSDETTAYFICSECGHEERV